MANLKFSTVSEKAKQHILVDNKCAFFFNVDLASIEHLNWEKFGHKLMTTSVLQLRSYFYF